MYGSGSFHYQAEKSKKTDEGRLVYVAGCPLTPVLWIRIGFNAEPDPVSDTKPENFYIFKKLNFEEKLQYF
jgi:hypothetical protein